MGAIYQKELKSYFNSMMGYIVLGFILIVGGFFACINNFMYGSPYFESCLYSVSFVLLFVVPILTMRSLSDEKHSRTDQLLYALPMSMTKIILGKYFAMLTVFGLACGVMAIYPLLLTLYGSVNFVTAYASLLAFFLLGAALIAIGMFMSSLTESQVIAAVLSFGAMLLCYLITTIASVMPTSAVASYIGITVAILLLCALVYFTTKNYWTAFGIAILLEGALLVVFLVEPTLLEGTLGTTLSGLALFDRLTAFIGSGLFDITALVYYLSVSAVFVFFTVQTMEKKRWS